MISRTCETCHKIFSVYPSTLKYYATRFCSRKCYTKTGKENPKWRGGRRDGKGYVYVYCPTHPHATKAGYVLEHRLVMERKLGRYLERREVVHHIDGNKMRNVEENLVVCISTGKHSAEHHIVRNPKGQFKKH